MMQRFFKLLLVGSLVMLPVQKAEAKKCKKFCCLTVKGDETICGDLTVRGNETIAGVLTLAGSTINNLIPIANAIGTGTVSPLISSIVPFSSGLITIATTGTLPTSGLVMAFGSNDYTDLTVPATVAATETAFAFSVPRAGTLHDLRVSVDGVYPVGIVAAPFTFTFTLLHSSCVDGTLTAYTSTGLTASATLTPQAGSPFGVLTPGLTGCGSSAGSIAVAAGDRIVLLVTPSAAVADTDLANLALSAGVLYSPVL